MLSKMKNESNIEGTQCEPLLRSKSDLRRDTHKQNGVSESARYTSSTINESSNGKCASRFTSKKTPRNLTIVQPTVTESSPNTPLKGLTVDLSSASFAGGMPRTPLTPSTIFNFELPHSPGLPHSPAYVDSRPRAFSFGKVSIPTTLEEVIEDSDSTSKKSFVQSEEARTNWRSIWIMAFILFLVKMQFSVYYATVWPFLQEMDPTATTTFYGFMTASYSLGAALSAPLFGYWSNKMKQIKLPAVTGIVIMFLANLCFMFIEFIPTNRKYFLLLARLGHGIGIGASILLQTYSAIASANKDKSTAAAISDGAYCLGLAFGPVFQLVFAPLGYPGISIGPLAISMYTAPAYAANAMVLLALFFIIFIFNEQLTETLSEENSENDPYNVLPDYDRLAISLCVFIKFVQMFMYANLETVGSPYSMIVFQWTRSQAAQYNSALVSSTGFAGFAFLVLYIWTKVGRRMDNRIGLLIGLIICLMFQVLTYPWKLYSGKISYRDELAVNEVQSLNIQTVESVGCPRSFKWCASTPAINVYFYNSLYVILFGVAFPLVNVHLAAMFCACLGPRRQGTLQGVNILISSLSRALGPVLIMELFNDYGPKLVWLIEIAIQSVTLVPFFLMYKRLVPLKTISQMVAGDRLKYKNGYIYRF